MSGGSDKTEKATPKRREEARKEGNVARSMEVNSALAMLAGFGVLLFWGPGIWHTLSTEMQRALRASGDGDISLATVGTEFTNVLLVLSKACMPMFLAMAVVGVIANVIQVKFRVTPQVVKPRFSKLNPINGFKQKFSPASLVELVKSVGKIVVVGGPATWIVWKDRELLLALGGAEPIVAGQVALDLIIRMGLTVAVVYIAVAIADYIWQRHRYEKNLRMAKHEVKQEARQQDVAPEIKAAQRRRQREAARRRMLADVPTADVIITNPTHYAVALRYDPDIGAPQVVAKGVDLLALRIREIADEAGVTRVENRPLARELYATVEVGHVIPPELFTAVAEVLAFVYRQNQRRAGTRTMQHA